MSWHLNVAARAMAFAALGPEETRIVGELIRQLEAEGAGIFLISHDMPDVFALSDRLAVMKNGRMVGTCNTRDVTEDEVLGMIIRGQRPEGKAQVERLQAWGRRRLHRRSMP